MADDDPRVYRRLIATIEKADLSFDQGGNGIAIADLNGDGVNDLFLVTKNANRVWFGSGK